MCGIAGILSYRTPVDRTHVQRMTQTLRHRGPDDEGLYLNCDQVGQPKHKGPYVGLGHRRLSIIDLSTGQQPIHNETKDVWIVFNGEIYNFQDLKNRLTEKGHRFYTTTDTEAIVHLYEEYAEECVKYLRGMFAFALWDEKNKKLLIARDRLGKKPLYYQWQDEALLFASELKGIMTHDRFHRELNYSALSQFLRNGYLSEPISIFKHTEKLRPGHSLTLQNGQLRQQKFWEINFDQDKIDDDTVTLSRFRDKLEESVRVRLVSDVPVGAFLSGGVDSSTVVALMASLVRQPVKTFCIGFEEPDYDERSYARIVAERYNTDHHEKIVRPGSFDLIEKIVRFFDEPFGDSSAIPTYFVSQLAGEHVKVVLSGDGGDELFGGYDTYAVNLNRRKFEKIPTFIRAGMRYLSESLPAGFRGKNYLYNISLPLDQRFIDYVSFISNRKHFDLLSPDMKHYMLEDNPPHVRLFEEVKGLEPLSQLQYVDMHTYLTGDILVKVDRMSMAHSLETRVPFLDQELVEFVNRLPARFKLNGDVRKYILKQVAAELLPGSIINRPKKGFSVPLKYWFKEELISCVRQILFEAKTVQRGYFDQNYLAKLIKEHVSGHKDHSTIMWHLLVLEFWHRNYMDL